MSCMGKPKMTNYLKSIKVLLCGLGDLTGIRISLQRYKGTYSSRKVKKVYFQDEKWNYEDDLF